MGKVKDKNAIRDRKKARRHEEAAKRAPCACCGQHKEGMHLVEAIWLCPGCDHISKKKAK